MAAVKQLGGWRCGTSLVGPRDGAMLRSIADNTPHRTHDQAPPRAPTVRRGDRDPGKPRELICVWRNTARPATGTPSTATVIHCR
jgi:hypothetical protein